MLVLAGGVITVLMIFCNAGRFVIGARLALIDGKFSAS